MKKSIKISEETRKKMSEAHKGFRFSAEAKKKMSDSAKGKIRSLETRKKISIAQTGKVLSVDARRKVAEFQTGRTHSAETKEKISLKNKGRKLSVETRKKMSENHRKGAEHHNWRNGSSKLNAKIRASLEYKLWREAVFERDNWTCVWCFQRGSIINADHIKPFSLFPEIRFAIDNGRTLCVKCHRKTDTYGGRLKQN